MSASSALAERLQTLVPGLRVFLPGSDAYRDSTSTYNAWTRPTANALPECVVWPRNPEQIADLLKACKKEGLALPTLRSGGCDRSSACLHGRIMIDLSPHFIEAHVGYRSDSSETVAYGSFQGGCRIVDIESRARYDLPDGRAHATSLASWPALGVGSILNTQGFGVLSRTFGNAIENVLEADIVTADGEIVRTSPKERTDLWAKLVQPPWKDPNLSGMFCVSRLSLRLYPMADDQARSGHMGWSFPASKTFDMLQAWSSLFKAGAPKELNSSIRLFYAPDGNPGMVFSFVLAPSSDMLSHSSQIDTLIAQFNTIASRLDTTWTMEPGFRAVADFQQVVWRLPGILPTGTRQDMEIQYPALDISESDLTKTWNQIANNLSSMPASLRPLSSIMISLAASPMLRTPPFDKASYEIIYSGRWNSQSEDNEGTGWIASCRSEGTQSEVKR